MSLDYIVLLGCSGSGKSTLAKALRGLPDTMYAGEYLFPSCIAHILGSSISPEIYSALSIGFRKNLHNFQGKGDVNSRVMALPRLLSGDVTLKRAIQALIRKAPQLSA